MENSRVEITLVPLLHDQTARLVLPHAVQAVQVKTSSVTRDRGVIRGRGLAGEVFGLVESAGTIVAGILDMY